MRRIALFVSLFASVGCGSSSSSPGGTNGDTGTTTSDTGGTTEDAPFTSDAPPGPTLTSGSIGPIPVGAGEDKTVCVDKRLDNADELLATRLVADLEPGSHHMIVYKSSATAERLEPYACDPFDSLITSSDSPILLVNARHVDFSFPAGVGLKIGAHQMVRIEAHYVNASKTALTGQGTFSVQGKKLAEAGEYQLADFSFWGTRSAINIAPKSHGDTGKKFQRGITNTKGFALTTHQHMLGSQVDVWLSAKSGDVPATTLLTETDWASPKLVPVDVSFDGTNGLTYQCQWENPTDRTVKFGESGLTGEMCFILLYYYPSKGFDLCVDGFCKIPH